MEGFKASLIAVGCAVALVALIITALWQIFMREDKKMAEADRKDEEQEKRWLPGTEILHDSFTGDLALEGLAQHYWRDQGIRLQLETWQAQEEDALLVESGFYRTTPWLKGKVDAGSEQIQHSTVSADITSTDNSSAGMGERT